MNYNCVTCDRTLFDTVCTDLKNLRAKGHERLSWDHIKGHMDRTGYLPKTCQKACWIVRFLRWLGDGAWFQRYKESEKTVQLAFDFFSKHEQWLSGHSETISKLLELRIENSQLRNQIQNLWVKVRIMELQAPALEAVKQLKQKAKLEAKESVEGAQKAFSDAINKSQKILLNADEEAKRVRLIAQAEQCKSNEERELFLKNLALEKEALLEELHVDITTKRSYMQAELGSLQTSIDKLKEIYESIRLSDTLIKCKDGYILIAADILIKIDYFKAKFNFPIDLKPNEAEKAQYPNVKNFIKMTEWSKEIVQILVDLVSAPVEKIPNIFLAIPNERILECYYLANYIQHKPLLEGSLGVLKRLNKDLSMKILASTALIPQDPLVRIAIEKAIANFQTYIKDPRFLHVNGDYLSCILSSDQLQVNSEAAVWAFVKRWLQENEDVLTPEIISSVNSQIRFENFKVIDTEADFDPSLNRSPRILQSLITSMQMNSYTKLDELQAWWTLGFTKDEWMSNWYRSNEIYTSKTFSWRGKEFTFKCTRINFQRVEVKLVCSTSLTGFFFVKDGSGGNYCHWRVNDKDQNSGYLSVSNDSTCIIGTFRADLLLNNVLPYTEFYIKIA